VGLVENELVKLRSEKVKLGVDRNEMEHAIYNKQRKNEKHEMIN
jgi:hypothetical protein